MKPGRAEHRVAAAVRFENEGFGQRAEREYRAALEIAPRHTLALNNLGLLLAGRGRFASAAPLFRRASLADPGSTVYRTNLAGALREIGDEAGAMEAYAQILAAEPGVKEARLNLANLLRSQGRLDEARPHYQALLARHDRDVVARWNLAALEGLAGNFDAAFASFAQFHAQSLTAPQLPLARWRGESLAGRRILLNSDQGLGDALMFVRYVPLLRDRGARVILRAQPTLAPLLAPLDGLESFNSRHDPLAAADVWFPLVDLPVHLGVQPPPAGPYIHAPADRLDKWSKRLPPSPRRRVGLVWAGNPTHPDDRNRSIPLDILLRPLLAQADCEFVSLQKGPRAADAVGTPLARADIAIEDFGDTATALTRLDLVIGADTSVLHLAGAMGRPVWGLLPFAPDWRWMLGRGDSPWYPSLRLFRQPRPGDWHSVADSVASALRD